jgi:hypothetical protein
MNDASLPQSPASVLSEMVHADDIRWMGYSKEQLARAATRSELCAAIDGLFEAVNEAIQAHKQAFGEVKARLNSLESRPELRYIGTWTGLSSYDTNNLVTHAGSLWICLTPTSARPGDPGPGGRDW